jgi:hypothetical protein
MFPMSISSISASTPVKAPDTSAPATPSVPDVNNDNSDADEAAQPPVVAALPPGQGTRINQLV